MSNERVARQRRRALGMMLKTNPGLRERLVDSLTPKPPPKYARLVRNIIGGLLIAGTVVLSYLGTCQ